MQTLLARNAWHRSLDALVSETGSPILELIPDTDSLDRQKDCMEKDEKQAMFQIALACLTEGELLTIQRRYGLNGGEPMSLSSIAAEDNVSRERIRQRIEAAHLKMRLRLKSVRLV
jgi:DNA-directed RNA polymerase sigma subunit (sigma70/sigma32)